jgi:hypothetical protein
MTPWTRRTFLLTAPLSVIPIGRGEAAAGQATAGQAAGPVRAAASGVPDVFPTTDPDVAREVVGVSHGNLARLKELVDARPALARASWDWGFGDWESALGAASHMGNREIAAYLLSKGARPSIFSAAMLGQLDVVKAFVTASPGIQRTPGPHGITLLAHAKAGGAVSASVVAYLESVGDADLRPTLVPLSDDEVGRLVGAYTFGPGAADRLVIESGRNGLTLKRGVGVGRNLHHLGSFEFFPAGASAVRVRFEVAEGPARALSVFDPDLVVTARRG